MCDHGAHNSTEEDVGGEMVAAGNAREADCASHAVGDEGDLAMLSAAMGDDNGDGGGSHGML